MSAPKWVPQDYADGITHTLEEPSAWLRAVPGGHALLDEHGEVPEDETPEEAEGERLADGATVVMLRMDNLGSAVVTIHDARDDGAEAFTVSRPMPALATDAWIIGEEDTFPTVEDLVEAYTDVLGEVSVRYLRWTEHRFRYRAETGTLEPEDPASLAPLPEEPEAPLPLFGGGQP